MTRTIDPRRQTAAHLDSLKIVQNAFDAADAVDCTSDEGLNDRDVMIRRPNGEIIHAVYEKHAQMFACFVSEPAAGGQNRGEWLGALDAPWAEHLRTAA